VIAARPLQPTVGPRLLGLGTLLALVAALGMALAIALTPVERPAWELIAGGLALLGVLALAVARYETAVALGFLLFAAVRVEPAPADAVFAVVIAVALATGRLNLSNTPLGPALGIAIFVALNLVACFEALDPVRAASFMAITVYLCVFGLWVATYVSDRRRARTVLRIYIGTAVFSAAIGAAALFLPFPGHESLTAYTGTRARALFKDPNVFGPFLVPALLLLLQETIEPRLLRSGRFMKLLGLAALCCGVLFSYSRAAWLDLVVGVVVMGVVFALRRGGARRAFVFMLTLVLGVAVLVVSIQVTGQAQFLKERAQYQTYDNQRFGAQSGGIHIGERHPIGVGPGQFELVEPISAHSTYVRALAEEGVLGFLALVALLYGTLLMALRNAVRGWDTHGIGSTALLAAWTGILANSVFVDTLHWRHLWLVAGLIWAASQTSSSAGTRLLK
jgi:O-antigen ligase